MGVLAVGGTGRFIFGGDEEEDIRVMGQRGGNKRGGGIAPENVDGPEIMAGVQSSNLTY